MRSNKKELYYYENSELLNSIAMSDYAKLQNKRIMIIDDSPSVLLYVKSIINKIQNTNLLAFDDEFEALREVKQNMPDLIIVDYNLKDLNGLELSKMLNDLSNWHAPILFISQDRHIKRKLVNNLEHKVAFLKKPLKQDVLLKQIQQCLNAA